MSTAKLVDLKMEDQTTAALYSKIPRKYLHSDSLLDKAMYHWSGEIGVENLQESDIIVVIDAWAYRQRHQENGKIVRLRTGGFPEGEKFRNLKLMGAIHDGKLYVVTEPSNKRVKDISSRTPVRIAGVGSAMKRFKKQLELVA